jgi:hypothetical protein
MTLNYPLEIGKSLKIKLDPTIRIGLIHLNQETVELNR